MDLHLILAMFGVMIAIHLIGRMFGIKIFPLGMFLSEDLDVPSREGRRASYGVLNGVMIYDGAVVVKDASGYAKPGLTATGLVVLGVADDQADNTAGQDGDIDVPVLLGTFRLQNSTDSDLITLADIGNACFLVDDETVAKTSGTNTRSVAGKIADVDDDGVWVEMPSATISTGGNLLATNNLSEVTPGPRERTSGRTCSHLNWTSPISSAVRLRSIISLLLWVVSLKKSSRCSKGTLLRPAMQR